MATEKDFKRKIKSPDELKETVKTLKAEGKRIVQCHGIFDFFHRGHLYQFEQAKAQGDVLIVSVTTDKFVRKGLGRPIFSLNIRLDTIAALEIVDYVTYAEASTSVELIKLLKPDVYAKREDCAEDLKDPLSNLSLEKIAVESFGGQMFFCRVFFYQDIPVRSSSILNNLKDPYPEVVLEYLKRLMADYSFEEIVRLVNSLEDLKVLIVGEAIIDQYDYIQRMGVSPKGGVIANRHLSSELFAGGTLACANLMANFCREVTLLSVIGSQNSHDKFIQDSLASNIKTKFIVREGLTTIIKRREVDSTSLNKVAETYFMNDEPLNTKEEAEVMKFLKQNIESYDLVFVADYGHGFITDAIKELIVTRSKYLAVNAQTNSANRGYNVITQYSRVDFTSLADFEARLALHDKKSAPDVVAKRLKDILGASIVAITLGKNGSVLLGRDGTYHTPVFSRNVVDTIGAGHLFFSVAALCAVKGLPTSLIGFLGNLVGGLSTTYIGTSGSVTKSMLFSLMRSLMVQGEQQ